MKWMPIELHIPLPVGKANVLMGSDVLTIMGQVIKNNNRNTILISTESREEADKLFNGLSEGGKIEMLIADGPMGSYFGMFADKYGVQRMVHFDPKYRFSHFLTMSQLFFYGDAGLNIFPFILFIPSKSFHFWVKLGLVVKAIILFGMTNGFQGLPFPVLITSS